MCTLSNVNPFRRAAGKTVQAPPSKVLLVNSQEDVEARLHTSTNTYYDLTSGYLNHCPERHLAALIDMSSFRGAIDRL